MTVHFDVVVEPGATALPFGVFEWFRGQWLENGTLDRLEQRAPAAADPAHGAGVQPIDQLADRHIEFAEREELAVTKLGQGPPLPYLPGDFNLGRCNRLA